MKKEPESIWLFLSRDLIWYERGRTKDCFSTWKTHRGLAEAFAPIFQDKMRKLGRTRNKNEMGSGSLAPYLACSFSFATGISSPWWRGDTTEIGMDRGFQFSAYFPQKRAARSYKYLQSDLVGMGSHLSEIFYDFLTRFDRLEWWWVHRKREKVGRNKTSFSFHHVSVSKFRTFCTMRQLYKTTELIWFSFILFQRNANILASPSWPASILTRQEGLRSASKSFLDYANRAGKPSNPSRSSKKTKSGRSPISATSLY